MVFIIITVYSFFIWHMPQKQVMTSLDLLWSDKDELADAINQISIYPVVIDKYPDHFKQILTMIIQYIHMHPNTDPFCFRFFRFSFCNTVAKCTLTYSRPILKNNDLNILPADYNKKSSHLFFFDDSRIVRTDLLWEEGLNMILTAFL